MSRIEPVSMERLLEEHPEAVAKQIAKLGTVPTAFRIMAHRPKILAAVSKLSETIMLDETTISPELKWMIAYTVSSAVECRYCQAHTATYATVTRSGTDKIKALWNFEHDTQFSDAERAALRVARAAGQVPNQVTDEMFEEMKAHYSTEQIVDIVGVIAHFGWYNRWNDTFATGLEDEPLEFARKHLQNANAGWTAGKHVPSGKKG